MDEQENKKQIKDEFLKSRDGAIVRCTSIIVDLKRPDLAKQILVTTKITRERFEEIKALNT